MTLPPCLASCYVGLPDPLESEGSAEDIVDEHVSGAAVLPRVKENVSARLVGGESAEVRREEEESVKISGGRVPRKGVVVTENHTDANGTRVVVGGVPGNSVAVRAKHGNPIVHAAPVGGVP